MMKHIICQIGFPVNISCLFFIVVIILQHVIFCFWTSYYIIRTFLIITNNASFKYLIEYICPNFIFHLNFSEFGKYCRGLTAKQKKIWPLYSSRLLSPLQTWENQRECPPGKWQGLGSWAVTPASCYLKNNRN